MRKIDRRLVCQHMKSAGFYEKDEGIFVFDSDPVFIRVNTNTRHGCAFIFRGPMGDSAGKTSSPHWLIDGVNSALKSITKKKPGGYL